jgi:hypothetical protein
MVLALKLVIPMHGQLTARDEGGIPGGAPEMMTVAVMMMMMTTTRQF